MYRKSKHHFYFWPLQLFFLLLALVALAMIGMIIYVIVVLMIDLVRSDNIKTELHHMKESDYTTNRIFSAMVASILGLIFFLIYLAYSISFCALKRKHKDIFCSLHPRIGYHGTLGLKLLFLVLTTLGMGWSIFLHQHPHEIKKWQVRVLVLLMMPMILVFAILLAVILGETGRYSYYY